MTRDDPLATAVWRVTQSLKEIAAVVTAPDTVIADLHRVADVSTTALDAYEATIRPYMQEAVDFYRFRTEARQCCTWDHPYTPLAEGYTILSARMMDAHGDLTNLFLHLTGDDCVW
jgi:hypothetical protein